MNMLNKLPTMLFVAVGFALSSNSIAAQIPLESKPSKHEKTVDVSSNAHSTVLTQATVRKIDMKQQKITLKHQAISSIGMPAMTMVFHVADPSLLQGINIEDSVLFAVEKQGSKLVVTQLQQTAKTTER